MAEIDVIGHTNCFMLRIRHLHAIPSLVPLPYSLDLTQLDQAYAQGVLTPAAVVRDIHAAIAAVADNPIWIHVVPEP